MSAVFWQFNCSKIKSTKTKKSDHKYEIIKINQDPKKVERFCLIGNRMRWTDGGIGGTRRDVINDDTLLSLGGRSEIVDEKIIRGSLI